MKAIIAIDIGTSSARAALVDQTLKVRALGSRTYRLQTPQPGYAEQAPEEIFDALCQAIDDTLKERDDLDIVGFCLDTAMHSFLPLDGEGNPLTPAWTWADMRAARTATQLGQDAEQAAALYARTGSPVHAMYFPAKARWLQQNDPDTFARASMITSIKGYILEQLTGVHVDDLAIASGYGLLNLEGLHWDEFALEAAGLTKEQLPRLVEPMDVVGHLRSELASRWGLDPLPVVAGGSDGPLANIGAGCVEEGDMAITVGTSSAVRMVTAAPRVDDAARTWCYYLGGRRWVVGGAINGGASSLTWLREAFPGLVRAQGAEGHAEVDQLAASVPPGSEGLLFAPYLAGERNPGLQGEARGYMAGISLHHSGKHFIRATMEGIAYQIAWVYQSVHDVAGYPKRIRVTGGFVGSSVWTQILADVLGRTLEIPAEKEGSLIGCAIFGLAALDPSIDWRELAGQIPVQGRIEPNMDNHAHYARVLKVYQEVYASMRPHFAPILSLQEK